MGGVRAMPDLFSDIVREVSPLIRTLGFKGSGQNYRKASDKVVAVINFQKSSGGEQFYVNLGVQPLFVPTEADLDAEPKTIKEYNCIFRKRVDPPLEMSGWPYGSEVLKELSARLLEQYQQYINPLMAVPGPITEAVLEDFPLDQDRENFLLGTRNPRNLFHFARIAKATNQPGKAVVFARYALDHCPEKASSLRGDLEEFLAEIGQSI